MQRIKASGSGEANAVAGIPEDMCGPKFLEKPARFYFTSMCMLPNAAQRRSRPELLYAP